MRVAMAIIIALSVPASAQGVFNSPAPIDTSNLATQAQVSAAQAAAIANAPGTYTDAKAASAAPVQTVNTKTGAVTVPVVCRQQSNATAIPTTSPASLTWTFPLANNPQNCSFASAPYCYHDISTPATNVVFDFPLGTTGARSTTSVTYTYTAHASSVNVVVGGITIIAVGGVSGAPPSGSTVVLTCTAPPA